MSYKYVVGIDGGGTRCRALLQDIDGNTLGEGAAGPANIMTNPEQAMGSVIDATLDAIESAALPITCEEVLLAAGLAGANIPQAKQSFLALDNPFADTVVISDLHAACLGAHENQSGALIICGTGSAATRYDKGVFTDKGGYGLQVGDDASGAWLGLSAIKHVLLSYDGVEPVSELKKRICEHLNLASPQQLVTLVANYNAADFGDIAPVVIQAYRDQCAAATSLIQRGANYLNQLGEALINQASTLPLCLVGGLADVYTPLLSSSISSNLTAPLKSAEYGAISFAKRVKSE